MLSKEERNQLLEKLKMITSEIGLLKNELSNVYQEKEKAFNEREQNKSQISSLFPAMISSRKKRDTFSKEVKDIKESRTKSRELVKDRLQEIRALHKQRRETELKYKVKRTPDEIKQVIGNIEYRIETEAIQFSEEQRLMKKIKELKRESKESEIRENIIKDIKRVSAEINNLKIEGNTKHNRLQETAALSQKEHEDMSLAVKSVKQLRKNEKEAHHRFMLIREKFEELKNKLNSKLEDANTINGILYKDRRERDKLRKGKEESILRGMQKEVEDKIKKRMKLTTEDLLVMQKIKF